MSYILGFIPSQDANYKIRKVVGDIGRVFDGQSVNVRWVKPESFHISLLHLGDNLSFIRREYILSKIKKLNGKKFNVVLDKANVGISRWYKELIYLTLGEGGNDIRKFLYQLREIIRTKEPSIFIPHITLGRINKDLTKEEYGNLALDVRNTNKVLNIDKITFGIDSLHIMQVDSQGMLKIVKSLPLQ